jgi:hypothetical protein
MKPRFELQKRLPDGSAIPASQDEIAAADFKSKLEQSAKFVSQLATPRDRQYWAEQQRQLGNQYFGRGDYKQAMDIYLTCLVVKENTADFVNQTLLPILNNLAQCTLQLSMHKKTVMFCEMALEEASKANQEVQTSDEDSDESGGCTVDPLSLCKIYFKKAKALRLTGNYVEARTALNASMEQLERKEALKDMEESEEATSSLLPYNRAIQKEYRYLDTAEKEARKNQQRQKRAMQKVLSTSQLTSPSRARASSQPNADESTQSSLYEDLSPNSQPRQYSKLRARKNIASEKSSSPKSCSKAANKVRKDQHQESYVQYYWLMVARVTKYLLHLLGDDDEECDNEANVRDNSRRTQ